MRRHGRQLWRPWVVLLLLGLAGCAKTEPMEIGGQADPPCDLICRMLAFLDSHPPATAVPEVSQPQPVPGDVAPGATSPAAPAIVPKRAAGAPPRPWVHIVQSKPAPIPAPAPRPKPTLVRRKTASPALHATLQPRQPTPAATVRVAVPPVVAPDGLATVATLHRSIPGSVEIVPWWFEPPGTR